jgi:hypothetical protein
MSIYIIKIIASFKIFRQVVEDAVSSNSSKVESGPLVTSERYDFYSWRDDNNTVAKRGPAIIFSRENGQLAKNFESALKHLEYSPKMLNLTETEATLKSSELNNYIR